MNTLDLLRAARTTLLEKGWCKEQYGVRNGLPTQPARAEKCCSIGALLANLPSTPWCQSEVQPGEEYNIFLEAVKKLSAAVPSNTLFRTKPLLMEYNDFPTTTLEDVLAVYDKAILSLEQESQA